MAAYDSRRVRPRARATVLQLEHLEDRLLLAPVTWIGGSGDWGDGANWSNGVGPGPDDDATIDVAGVTVTHSTGSHTVKSLTINDPLTLSGGTLTLTETLEAQNGNAVSLAGGTLANAIITPGTKILATPVRGFLSGVTLDGTLDVTANSAVTVSDGLTLDDGLIKIGWNCFIALNGAQTLGGTGTVQFTDDNMIAGLTFPGSMLIGGGIFTIGPGVTVTGTNGSVFVNDSNGSVVNQGTIRADGAGDSITIVGARDTWTNQGTIAAAGGASVTLTGAWTNSGTISETDSILNLGGSFKTSDLGTINRSGGSVNLSGTLTNDVTLSLDDSTGSWNLSGGTILGGRVVTAGGAVLAAAPTRGILDSVTLSGTLDVTAPASAVHVTHGLTLDDGLIKIGWNCFTAIDGAQTLGGSGTVQFTDDNMVGGITFPGSMLIGSGLFTIGPGVTVTGTHGSVFVNDAAGSLLNLGTIRADGDDDSITIVGAHDTWTNQGTIVASNGGSITLSGPWTNGGTINETDSTLNLGGSFATSGLGLVTGSGGHVNITGVLTNDSALLLNASSGSWNLSGGTIDGGRITTSDGAKLLATAFSGGTLNNVTLAGALDLSDFDTVVRVTGGLTLDGGSIEIAHGSELSFSGTQTLGGTGTVTFLDNNAQNLIIVSDSGGNALTIGSGITIGGCTGGISTFFSAFINQGIIRADIAGGTITLAGTDWVNQGTISADVSGGQITLAGTNWINSGTIRATIGGTATLTGSWSNTGVVSVAAGTLNLGGTFTTSGLGTINRSSGSVNITGALTNDGTLGLDDTSGSWTLSGGSINGGRVATSGAAELVLGGGGGAMASVTLAGTLNVGALGAPTLTVTGGLTLDQGTVKLSNVDTLFFFGTQTLGGTGTVAFTDDFFIYPTMTISDNDTLTIAPGVTIHGINGLIGRSSLGHVLNQGAIVSDGGGTIIVAGMTNFAGGTLTGGTWGASGESKLRLLDANITTNAADIRIDGANALILSDSGNGRALIGLATNASSGRLTLLNGATLGTAGDFENQGSLTVGSGSTLAANGNYTSSGSTIVDGTLSGVAVTVVGSGSMAGSGTIYGNVLNQGEVDPGTSPGILSIRGTYTQAATGTLNVEISGATPGSQYDQLNITGHTSLDGILNVNLIDGFGATANQSFQVMTFGDVTGAFAVINGLSSGNRTLFEADLSSSDLVLKSLVTASDLAFVSFDRTSFPTTVAPGQSVSIGYTAHNASGTPADGDWVDSFYLSADLTLDPSDSLLGRVLHVGGVAGDESYSGALVAVLPALAEANYHVIALIDSRGSVADTNRANNVAASTDSIAVRIAALNLGETSSGTIASGQDRYFRLNLSPGSDVSLTADFTAALEAELYVRYADVPDRTNFDQSLSNPSNLQPQILLSNAQGGSYYILLHGRQSAGAGQPFSLRADTASLKVTAVTPDHGSSAGKATVTVSGSRLTPQTSVSLVGPGGAHSANSIVYKDDHTLFVTLDLVGLAAGTYDVSVSADGQTATSAGAFTVTTGKPGKLETLISSPKYVRLGQMNAHATIDYFNTGDTDIPAPLLTLTADHADLRLPEQSDFVGHTLNVLGINRHGPAGTLPPGYHGTIDVIFRTDGQLTNFQLYLPAAADTPMDWNALKAASQPETIANDAWDVIWSNFTAAAGPTVGTYESLLDRDATALSELGIYTPDPTRLFALEFENADAIPPFQVLDSARDASFPGPGLTLDFDRVFLQPIDSRFRLGRLGRGWVDSFDVTATSDSGGNVNVRMAGNIRLFTRKPDGSFVDSSGQSGTLTLTNNAFQLRETDGTFMVFRPDGQLNFVQDSNGNRITAGYTNGLLTSLTHSDGDVLALAYNAQGRIIQLTDPAGRVTAFTYDATGEQLVSATTFANTPAAQVTEYTYSTDPSGPAAHELQSVMYPGGTQVFFEYDAHGRLRESHFSDSAQIMHYSYDVPGGFEVRDAVGNVTSLLLDDQGHIARASNGLGQTLNYRYDAGGYLDQISAPGGGAFAYSNDARGNPLSMVTPAGRRTDMIYNPAVDALASLRDARGNTTDYQYDPRGNVTAITQPDGHGTVYSYDARGNVVASTNERGQTIQFSYNARGQVIRKDFPDGSHVEYAYDAHGNLISASQTSGVTTLATTFTYNSADELTQVTYPDGRFLQYVYDTAGHRIQMSDQDGFVIYYGYDTAGRLVDLSSGAVPGTLIVYYTYNAAGQIAREDRGNGTYTTYSYDSGGRLDHLVNFGPPPAAGQDGPVLSRFDYTFDLLGRITSVTTLDGTTSYGYDADGQLTSVTLPGGRTITYEYDAVGNRTAVIDNGVETDSVTNNLNQYTSAGGAAMIYDADGNLVSKTDSRGTTTYTYDAENNLIGQTGPAGTWTYEYDAFGNRVAMVHDGQRTAYVLDPQASGTVLAEYDASGLVAHYTQGVGLASRVDAAGSSAYYQFDAQGSTAQLTGPSGTVLNSYKDLPFGEQLLADVIVPNPFTFVGRFGVMDGGGGMYLMRRRFYSPEQGRFIQVDPIGLAGGTNVYRYANNNPVSLIDPSGQLGALAALGIGAGIGVAVGGLIVAAYVLGVYDGTGSLPEQFDFLYLDSDGPPPPGSPGGPAPGGPAPGALPPGGPSPAPAPAPLNAKPPTTGVPPTPPPNPGPGGTKKGLKGRKGSNGPPPGRLRKPPPPPPGPPGPSSPTLPVKPKDPNDIAGPAGFGDDGFIVPAQTLDYTIHFENKADATAPAQVVVVTEQLDSDLDVSTFELGDFGFGGQSFTVPSGRQFYSTRIDLRELTSPAGQELFVDVSAALNSTTGLVTWTFTSLDTQTLDQPADALAGFLPPNVTAPQGEGYVSYRVRPVSSGTGTRIDAQATVVFDTEDPLDTPAIFNTLDAGAPTSAVNPLPPLVNTASFPVTWSGSDDGDGTPGSGIAAFDVFVSDNAAPFELWLGQTSATSGVFDGQPHHTYRFYSIATDNVGHVQPKPTSAQAQTTVDTSGPAIQAVRMVADSKGISHLVLTTSKPLDPATATNKANYELRAIGKDGLIGTKDDVVLALGTPAYDATLHSVTITPLNSKNSALQGQLALGQFFRLVVYGGVGISTLGLTDSAGNRLDQDGDGIPDNYITTFARGSKLSYTDRNGDLVSLAITRGGVMELFRGSDGEAEQLRLVDTIANRSVLTGSVRKPKKGGGGDNQTSIASLTGSSGVQNKLPTTATKASGKFVIGSISAAIVDLLLHNEAISR